MDTVTHLVAGALTPLAFKNAPKTRMLVLFGILCGELPDIDVIAGKTPEAILAFHRGPTHALVAQPLFALLLALVFHRLLRKGGGPERWTFAQTWFAALAALLVHLFLDCMTTFGTQIFLPFSDLRVALPAIYIIDPWLTLPPLAVLGIILTRGGLAAPRPTQNGLAAPRPTQSGLAAPRSAQSGPAVSRLAKGALAWMTIYPLLALSLNYGIASHLAEKYAAPGNARGVVSVELSPEPFAPFNWKVVAVAPETYSMGRFFTPSPSGEIAFAVYARTDALFAKARETVPLVRLFGHFTTYPFVTVAGEGEEKIHTYADVRYEPTLPGLMAALGRSDGLFRMQLKARNGVLTAWRFLYRGRDAATTPWEPVPGGANG